MNSHKLLFLNILLLASIGQVAADMYLPSLPAIAHDLVVDSNVIEWSVSVYMWGFALSQLIYGPFSDAIGRRKPLLVGLGVLFIGSLVCVFAQSAQALLLGRLLQGVGAGSGASLSWVILRDTHEGETMAKYGSYLAMSGIVLMACAPLLGGLLQWIFNWHANFIFLALYSFFVLGIIVKRLPETNQHQNRLHLKARTIIKNSKILLNHVQFKYYCLVVMISYGGILGWLTVGPILLQKQSGLSPIQFGTMAVLTGAAYGLGNLINTKCVEHFKASRMIHLGLLLMLIASISMLFLWFAFHSTAAWMIVVPTMLFVGSTGFVFSNSIASALNPFPKMAGFAGSMFGCLQISGGATTSAILASLPETTQVPLGLTLLACSMVGLIAFMKIQHGERILSV